MACAAHVMKIATGEIQETYDPPDDKDKDSDTDTTSESHRKNDK